MIFIRLKQSIYLIFLIVFVSLLWIKSTAQTIKAENVHYIPDVEVTFSDGVNDFRRAHILRSERDESPRRGRQRRHAARVQSISVSPLST